MNLLIGKNNILDNIKTETIKENFALIDEMVEKCIWVLSKCLHKPLNIKQFLEVKPTEEYRDNNKVQSTKYTFIWAVNLINDSKEMDEWTYYDITYKNIENTIFIRYEQSVYNDINEEVKLRFVTLYIAGIKINGEDHIKKIAYNNDNYPIISIFSEKTILKTLEYCEEIIKQNQKLKMIQNQMRFYNTQQISKWYKEKIYKQVKNIFIESDNYVIGPFSTFNEIEFESESLHHALAIMMYEQYKCREKNFELYKWYPLYLRKKSNRWIPYATVAIEFKNGEANILNTNMEEAVLDENLPLKKGDLKAYNFLLKSLPKITKQIKL